MNAGLAADLTGGAPLGSSSEVGSGVIAAVNSWAEVRGETEMRASPLREEEPEGGGGTCGWVGVF